eukprot:CAMPEP_0177185848 /NCGR_PEP_ID=MMETSP0367-20130122/18323_1 /TAXON_ID=447022 ORGANISM="Scrippsiella hangoei-like, Strain SHHI-4" /NCGR_SAMPLE_ID=MMETSP0367 /ASSEMBLY_ACC=CAM_ASM_000362 /LENGTH=41 /DNA_ID= /DNA_START= /DNA_END= /DNA_ORIENTATION=
MMQPFPPVLQSLRDSSQPSAESGCAAFPVLAGTFGLSNQMA